MSKCKQSMILIFLTILFVIRSFDLTSIYAHQRGLEDSLHEWKSALKMASNLSGWDSQHHR